MARGRRALRVTLKVLFIIAAVVAVISLSALVINRIHRGNMEKYIDGFGRVEYENQLLPSVDEAGNCRFVTDRDFKVMQLTDLHLGGGFLFSDGDRRALYAVAEMIRVEKPDLVIVTGDISFAVPWSGTLNNAIAHSYFTRLMENLGVYYTVAFGNHDTEKYNFHDRAAVAEMYSDKSLEHCLFSSGPSDIYGECNHVITVENSRGLVTSLFVMIDSNSYSDKDIFGLGWDYDNVHADQIEWYKDNIEYYTARNLSIYNSLPEGERPAEFDTGAVSSYIFMHIPPEEMRIAFNEAKDSGLLSDTDRYGVFGEKGPVVYCSEYPDMLFETVLELGSTRGIFFGHDHINTLRLEYKGVLLAYGNSIDYSAYAGDVGYQRGCTLLTVGERGIAEHRYSNYYSGRYNNLDDDVDMNLP